MENEYLQNNEIIDHFYYELGNFFKKCIFYRVIVDLLSYLTQLPINYEYYFIDTNSRIGPASATASGLSLCHMIVTNKNVLINR